MESARQAAELDQRIVKLWADHPDRTLVPPAADFATKALTALDMIRSRLPGCCRSHRLNE